jgi:hypothetical protein
MENNKLSDYLEKAETLTETSRPELINLEKFTTVLNTAPDRDKIKTRQNISYLNISTIENELDRLYAGLWQVKNLSFTIVTNEILVSLDLPDR